MHVVSRAWLAAAVMAAIVAACTGAPAATPAPTPAQAASPVLTPVPAPAKVDDILAAAKALDDTRSYRFSEAMTKPAATARSVVVNGSPHRVRTESFVNGEVAAVSVEIGERWWIGIGGSNLVEQTGMGRSGDDPWRNPLASTVEGLTGHLKAVDEVGVEDRAGVRARHLRGTAAFGSTPSTDASGDTLDMDVGFVGLIDAWIAIDDGHLVALRADGTQVSPSWGKIEEEEEASPTSSPYTVEVSVEGVDDPANVVDEPAAAEATSRPSGDPAATALIEGIADGMRGLTAYVLEQSTETAGVAMTANLTVVNRPVPSVRSEIATGVEGFPGMGTLLIGDRAWSRSGDDPWAAAAPGEGPTCGESGQSSSEYEPCTFERMTDVGRSLVAMAPTFSIVATDEVVDGVVCTRLRSEAGTTFGKMTIPGTTDIWIANDGGYLVEDDFAGAGFEIKVRITRINDPTVVLEPPTP